MSNQIWLNGKLVPAEQAVVSVYDHGLLYGDGVFEGIRAYRGRIFKAASHLRRLADGARAIRLNMPYSSEQLLQAMRDTLAANQRSDSYIRLCVTRGCGTLGLNPFNCKDSSVFIITDDIALYPRKFYEEGMAIITSSVMRNHSAALSPRIKSLNYLNNIMAKIEAIDAGVMEAVMLNPQGYVTECTGDNLFIVRNVEGKAVLLTPPLQAGILEGITRNAVIELARAAGLDVRCPDLTRYDLYTAEEMFLTGTAAEVIPVTHIDGRTIGDGKPGPVTRRLHTAFHQLVAKDAPED
ncbi:MAG: branched-chain-amino-acid transaminase [Phycisphaeraceae bacterium]|nr:branched-chain-amino-acid transaminase [Phycisphaeraceae bacterium]